MKALLVGGVEDHLHTLLGLPPALALSDAVKRIKGGSSGWIREHLPGCRGFGWQDGYAAFTVSRSQAPEVEAYIRGQREGHRVRTFQDEYRALLDRHGIEYEERYLWD
jgi:REP element-mobilizing transposase RayT